MKYNQVAIYARVSSEQQVEENTINSQLSALRQKVTEDGFNVSEELTFIDDGYSGATLIRPGLEKLRDMVSMHSIDRLYVHSPDRLARKYAYQVLLVDEFKKSGLEVIFVNHPLGQSAEDDLLLQVQGMIAEYERAKILERSRRGKRHAAQSGEVSVLSNAPYGYRYTRKQEGGGHASYEVFLTEARVVRQIFKWAGEERISIREICHRLEQKGELTSNGKTMWNPSTIRNILKNPAYMGMAAFGRKKVVPRRPQLRAYRGASNQSRRPVSIMDVPEEGWSYIPVPALVSKELFEAVQVQMEENRKRRREHKVGVSYLLQGLLVCSQCGYAYYGKRVSKKAKGQKQGYSYYRCPGIEGYRFGGERICDNHQVRTDILEEAVWKEVSELLKDPHLVAREYDRRLTTKNKRNEDLSAIEREEWKVKNGISRLIDSYTNGLIEKEEFEPRVKNLRQRLSVLEEQSRNVGEEISLQNELRLIITRLEDFAKEIELGLSEAEWLKKREIIRTVVKRIEIGKEEVNVVYRIPPEPFDLSSDQNILQYCTKRHCH